MMLSPVTMVDFQVKTVIGYLSASVLTVKKIGSAIIIIPKKILKSLLIIQLKAAYIPVCAMNCLCKSLLKKNESKCVQSEQSKTVLDSKLESQSTTKENGIVKEVKDLRNLTLKAIHTAMTKDAVLQSREIREEFLQRAAAANIPTQTEAAKGVETAVKYLYESDGGMNCIENKAETLRKTAHLLEERDALTQSEYENLMEEKEAEKEVIKFLSSFKPFLPPEENRVMNDEELLSSAVEVLQILAKVSIKENILLRRRLCRTNNKFEEVLLSFNSLIKELAKLNRQLGRLSSLNTKLASLEVELNEGKKLLQEVEADRNQMREKLVTLHFMIKEEEEFLNDADLERGIDEFHILKCLEKYGPEVQKEERLDSSEKHGPEVQKEERLDSSEKNGPEVQKEERLDSYEKYGRAVLKEERVDSSQKCSTEVEKEEGWCSLKMDDSPRCVIPQDFRRKRLAQRRHFPEDERLDTLKVKKSAKGSFTTS